MSNQNVSANDYALANYLNKRVVAIFAMIADYHGDTPDITALNRSYVLMVAELQNLYVHNPKLSDIKESICWRTFDTIDALDPYELYEYSDDYINHGIQHISQVNKLCEQTGATTPTLSPELQRVVNEAKANVVAFSDSWLIPEYLFEYAPDGSLLVNGLAGVMNVNKVQVNSATDMILTQAQAQPNVIFMPNLKGHSTERGLRTTLREVGFNGALEKLFMPVMDNQRGVMLRPKIKRADANKEHIELTQLDAKLKTLGAKTLLNMYDYPD